MNEWIPFISEVGFPIVVTLYLLYRIETKLNALIQAMENMPKKMREEMNGRTA
ncbi:YvrJ family protein [Bacillus sp. 1P06AnD]|uniref:YvrJ family protein n=1 Tax=Bacillus sp. 1P06AnD TaxID=3132208 RepID=UPI0039A11229